MKQELLNQALAILTERKNFAEDKANKLKKQALRDQTFTNLYNDYTSILIENARKKAFGEKVDEAILKNLKKAINLRLRELKISSIEPNYSCPACEDSGFIDGKYCDCLKKEVTKILLKKSGFGDLEDFSKSNFNIFKNKDEMKKIYSVMQEWCNKNSPKDLIYLLGETGTGKTHLLKCMANEFIKQNKIVLLTTAFNLAQLFLKYHTSKDKENVLDDILSCEVLFIDDLGSEPFFNNISREYMYLITNERRMKGLRTIITSNLHPDELRDRYDERVFSRIMDKDHSIVLKISGNDLRLQQKNG